MQAETPTPKLFQKKLRPAIDGQPLLITPPMPLSLDELEEIQSDLMADDVEIDFERMRLWDREKALSYFESGGGVYELPAGAPLLVRADVPRERPRRHTRVVH